MKFTTTIYSLALTCGYSQAQNVAEESPEERALWNQAKMLTDVLSATFPEPSDGWSYLIKYGCYCHRTDLKMASSQNGYHGPPLDELDSLCRDSFRAQKCLEDEFDREYSTDDNQSRTFPYYIDDNTNEIVCNNKDFPKWATKEHNQFRLRNCQIEREFVENVVSLIQAGYQRNDDYVRLANKRYERACPVQLGVGPANNECCGTGMTRKPFNTAMKQCCNQQIVDLGSC